MKIGTQGQATRDWVRKNLSTKTWWRVSVALFFTLVHDFAGLISASQTILKHFKFPFSDPLGNMFLIYAIIVLVDCGSEILIVTKHDLPLCKRKPIENRWIIVMLVGQFLTLGMWAALAIFVLYQAIVNTICLSEKTPSECDQYAPGFNEVLVIVIVFVKNSLTLKEFFSKKYVYPIICEEAMLFLHHFLYKDPDAVVKSFTKFLNLNEESKNSFFHSTTWHVGLNLVIVIALDFAAISSVLSLITVGSIPGMVLRATPFVIIIFLDIGSEICMLVVHDLPLCRDEDIVHRKAFNIARTIQVFVTLCWVGALIYMLVVVSTVNCKTECHCSQLDYSYNCSNNTQCFDHPFGICQLGYCNYTDSGLCSVKNNQVSWLSNNSHWFTNATESDCKINWAGTCYDENPTIVDCVLLGLILIENIVTLIRFFFKSFIEPIVIPPYVMHLFYWKKEWNEKILHAVGRAEFGYKWRLEELESLEGSPDESENLNTKVQPAYQ